MTGPSGLSVYAVSLAMLEDEPAAVGHLVDLAEGDAARLEDARDLLHSLRAQPERVERADSLIQRAITHVERGDRHADHRR